MDAPLRDYYLGQLLALTRTDMQDHS